MVITTYNNCKTKPKNENQQLGIVVCNSERKSDKLFAKIRSDSNVAFEIINKL